ncbi:MAG: hypothetical protein ABI573_10400 [Chloroflexota bacterium]
MSDPSPARDHDSEPTVGTERGGAAGPDPESAPASQPERPPRAFVERLGLAAVAVFVGGLFIVMAAAAWVGKEGFLALMAGLGGLMTLWAGFNSLRRG